MGLRRTYKHFRRYRQIAEVLLREGFGYLVDQLGLKRFLPWPLRPLVFRQTSLDPVTFAQRVRRSLEALGPTFIKLGQTLSTRPDLVPAEVIGELERLQDAVEPVPFPVVQRILEQELGGALSELFQELDPVPMASASLGQVHRAQLPAGETVVVKVQRPGIQRLIDTDLEILRTLAHSYRERLAPEGFDPVELVDEFGLVLQNELDYVIEAAQMERMARDFKSDPRVHIPKVHWSYTTSRVLTMEEVRGTKIDRVSLLRDQGIPLDQVARNLVTLYFEQIFLHGYFHGDPHPGNLFVDAQGVISFVDFGMMGYLDPDTLEPLLGVLRGIRTAQPRQIVRALGKLGILPRGKEPAFLQRDLLILIHRYSGVPLRDLSLGDVLNRIVGLVKKHHLRLPADLALLVKTVIGVEGLARKLEPQISPLEILETLGSEPWRWAAKGLGTRTQEKVTELAKAVPRIVLSTERVLGKLSGDELGIRFYHEGLEGFLHRLELISNRLTSALIVSALVIASSLVLLFHQGPTFFGYPVLGLTGYLLAGFLGFWLLVSILRAGKL